MRWSARDGGVLPTARARTSTHGVGRRARTPRAAPIAALIAALLLSSPAAAEELQQILEFQVSAPSGVVFEDVVVVFDRLGEEIEVVLADDGRDWVDLANDGVYLGRHQGEYSRYISVRIRANLQDGTSPEIYSGVVRTGDRHRAELGWIVMTGQNGSLKAMRAATAYPGNRVWHQDVAQLVASAGWAVFLLYYVSRLVWLRRKERAGCPPSNAPS